MAQAAPRAFRGLTGVPRRGTAPPPHEDHAAAEVAEPEFEGLVAAAGRSRAQLMALDLTADPSPMAEAHVATLARRGVVPERNLTWLQASLLIDDATGCERGERAANWLRRNGASSHEAAKAVERAADDLRTPPGPRERDAADVRAEVLEGRDLSAATARELATLRRAQAAAAHARRREERLAWARQAPPGPTPRSGRHTHEPSRFRPTAAANHALICQRHHCRSPRHRMIHTQAGMVLLGDVVDAGLTIGGGMRVPPTMIRLLVDPHGT